MSSFEEREKMLIDKLSATDPLAQVAQVAKHLPQQEATKILRYATSSGDALGTILTPTGLRISDAYCTCAPPRSRVRSPTHRKCPDRS